MRKGLKYSRLTTWSYEVISYALGEVHNPQGDRCGSNTVVVRGLIYDLPGCTLSIVSWCLDASTIGQLKDLSKAKHMTRFKYGARTKLLQIRVIHVCRTYL